MKQSINDYVHSIKKKIIRGYHDYLTIDGQYTSLLPDKIYLKKLYKRRLGKNLNLRNPKTYCEKLNWLKLYDRRPEYTVMVDKYSVRDYIEEKIQREGYSCSSLGLNFIPILGVWDRVEDIDFDSLPDQFVLKCNHDNGVIICKDKSKMDVERTRKELEYHFNRNWYKKNREWPYKNVKRKIIAEQYMCDDIQPVLVDYKFFCFSGEVKALYIVTDRLFDTKIDFFDRDFYHLPIINGHPNSSKKILKPLLFDKMIKIAEILSKDLPHVRVDFYLINDRVYFGEMTFYHDAGLIPLDPDKWNYIFGDWIALPQKRRR